MESPFLGVGAGDFPIEYERINNIYSPEVDLTVQPHNMYLLVLAQLGLIGLYSFAMVFFLQFKIAFQEKNISIHNIIIIIIIIILPLLWTPLLCSRV